MLNQSTVMTDLVFDEIEAFESSEWEEKISPTGKILKDKGVRQILLVHGTFAGNDALGLFDLLEPIEQEVTGFTTLSKLLKVKGKDLLDRIAGDIGNYTPEYVESMGSALGHQIDCKLFTWGSGNFHLARLRGVVDLAADLAGSIAEQKMTEKDRLLLLGHSHAGQLFALLTTLLEGGDKAQHLCQAIRMSQRTSDGDKLLVNLDIIKTVKLDIVTFGTPVRYAWGRYDRYRLLWLS